MQEIQNPPNQYHSTVMPGATDAPPVPDLLAKGMQVFDALLSESLNQSDRQAAAFDVTMTGLFKCAFRIERLIDAEWPSKSGSIEEARQLYPSMDLHVKLAKQAAQYKQLKMRLSKQPETS